jgi:glycosyltransferase involved in cell wall biosynthesis
VFNGERYLAEAVRSILAQTHQHFELLIFDDASTDSSWSLLHTFQDPRLLLHRNERNLGPEGNWNLALAATHGSYIKLFHQDDLLSPDCLARQVATLEGLPQAVMAFSSRTIIRPDGSRLFDRSAPWPTGEVEAKTIVQGCLRSGTNLIGEPSAVLFRTEVARKTGSFDGQFPYVIDLDYWLRLLEHGSGYCLQSPLASFRISKNQWSTAIGRRQSRQFIAFLDKLTIAGQWQIGTITKLRGKTMSILNQLMRLLVYHILLKDIQ